MGSGELLLNLVASCTTGAVVMLLTNPLDTLKARWQTLSPVQQRDTPTPVALARLVSKEEGIARGLWAPALGTNMLACALAVGARLGLYPHIRDALCTVDEQGRRQKQAHRMWASGLLAGSVGYFVANPLFLVTKRIQAAAGRVENGVLVTGARKGQPPTHRTGWGALRALGLRGCWLGSGLLVLRGGVMSASQTSSYDYSKTTVLQRGWGSDGPQLHFLASFLASFVCVTCVIPFDVVLTRYQTAAQTGRSYPNPLTAAAALHREEGIRVFGRGWTVMFVRMAPSSVISFFVFEQLRQALGIGFMD